MLTPREAEVLRMAAEGLDNRAIATALAVSERTVKFHLQNTYRKLGVSNRTAASATARRLGIIQ
ncbi:MAG: response regulator transcription factor [Actinomycetota bacterium]|nr:response regulator transcription factor [Actinomycetota bacterium]